MNEILDGLPADAGPVLNAPDLLGLCKEHGWWFEADHSSQPCPQPGCLATVLFYRRSGVYVPRKELER